MEKHVLVLIGIYASSILVVFRILLFDIPGGFSGFLQKPPSVILILTLITGLIGFFVGTMVGVMIAEAERVITIKRY